MKYNYESLNEAIYKVIPEFKTMASNGIAGNQPMMLNSVASKFFVTKAWEDQRDFELQLAYYICQRAMQDLNEFGYFNFEDIN